MGCEVEAPTLNDGCDVKLARCIFEEYVRVGGTHVDLYFQRAQSPEVDGFHDPLYDEPASDDTTGNERFQFQGPYHLPAIAKKASKDVSATDSGERIERADAQCWLAVNTIEGDDDLRKPKRGDIFLWSGRHYTAIKVSDHGFMADNLTDFVSYEISMKRLERFKPERLLDVGDVAAP